MSTPTIDQTLASVALRKRDKAKRAKEKTDNDANYYVVLVFDSQSLRDDALSAMGWNNILDDVFLPGSLLDAIRKDRDNDQLDTNARSATRRQ